MLLYPPALKFTSAMHIRYLLLIKFIIHATMLLMSAFVSSLWILNTATAFSIESVVCF